ncbi:dTMP kinase [Bacillaceae bacterium]
MKRGWFITFEGPDGSGKTSQLAALAAVAREMGFDVVTTREPGGTLIGDRIRQLLLDPANVEMHGTTEILLYAAARAQHVKEKILPALAAGKVVLCDRYVDASVAYQGYGLQMEIEEIKRINRYATGGLVPDRTYLLDIPVAVGRKRLLARKGQEFAAALDRIESRELAYHTRVREGFLKLAQEEPGRIVRIDADRPFAAIAEEIARDFCRLVKEGWQ